MAPTGPEETSSPSVFISYASRDRAQVLAIAAHLQSAGVSVWLDQHRIEGGMNYGQEIVTGIKGCRAFLLMCTDASMRSRAVKVELQLAWKYDRFILPLRLEPVSFPEQLEFWLEGRQWIDVPDPAVPDWLPRLLTAISLARSDAPAGVRGGLDGLRSLARFTDQLWPVRAGSTAPALGANRGLGAPQEAVCHGYPLGSRVTLVLESEQDGHVLLLDEGPEQILYCLCPSWFAPDTRVARGRNVFPQPGARFDSFVLTGRTGREQLLAIISREPLFPEWMPPDSRVPARVLSPADIGLLMRKLESLPGDEWTALATHFDIGA